MVIVVGVLSFMASQTRFIFKGHYQGIFLLHGRNGHRWELKDDLLLGDGGRLICSIPFEPMLRLFQGGRTVKPGEAYLEFEWDENDGSGWVRNVLQDGKELRFFFSRYIDDRNLNVKGLFLGGGLADAVEGESAEDASRMNDSGMAYYDGERWRHIWCTANEILAPADFPARISSPSSWRFLGAKVLHRSSDRVVLSSSNEAVVDGVPLRVDRFAYFAAGQPYFKLGIRLTNVGARPVRFYYSYGDEPWVGDYGSALGNLGWVKQRLLHYETVIDARRHRYAGLVDEDSGTANFIEWIGPNTPDIVCVSNRIGRCAPEENQVPLTSNEIFIGLQWGPHLLLPGQSERIFLAIGMASQNPLTGVPLKPEIPPDYLPDYLPAPPTHSP